MNDKITIEDLEVKFHVGVPDEERIEVQKLLITIVIFKDLSSSAENDDISKTIDYFSVCQEIKALGENQSWKLIETLASDICKLVLTNFKAETVKVIVKKFILPDTRWVSVDITRKI